MFWLFEEVVQCPATIAYVLIAAGVWVRLFTAEGDANVNARQFHVTYADLIEKGNMQT